MEEIEKLKAENEQLKKTIALKNDWIAISAHELRTSLSAIKWILKMFLDKDFGSITTEQEGFMKKAFDSTERILSLVNEMLSLNHAEDGGITYTYSKNNIIQLIEDVIFDFHGESFKKKVEVIFLKPSTLPDLINIDAGKIRVVIQNLIENAVKYSTEGDAVIVTVREDSELIEVSVKDNGIGIPGPEQPKIFEKFFRATNAKAKDIIGSGLGLYTIKSIIENHQGKMWFESKEDTGSTFFFSIPKNIVSK